MGSKRLLVLVLVILLLAASSIFADEDEKVILYYFWGEGCPHCALAKAFLEKMQQKYPQLEIKDFEVWHNQENAKLFEKMLKEYGVLPPYGVPTFFIGDRVILGYRSDETTGRELEEQIRQALGLPPEQKPSKIQLPLIGEIDPARVSLPLLTIIVAGVDGFNPCAIWVLCFLLTLLIYSQSRAKMLLVGGIFVFASAFVYFLFMAAWLNLFLFIGYATIVRVVIGLVAVLMGAVNVKDFFLFKRGISLVIPDSAKPGLIQRMRTTVKAGALPTMILGTIALAFAANFVELLCTAGFPAIYTRILTLQGLPTLSYYLYLVLYNVIYVIPLAVIVAIFATTMGAKKFTERQGRVLKLVSGTLMLFLGLLLIFKPELLMLG